MSIRVMAQVWDLDLKGPLKFTLLAYADFADDAGKCWPSHERVAQKTSTSRDTVRRHVRKLTELGLIEVDEGAGRNGTNLYHVRPDRGVQIATGGAPMHPGGVQNDPGGGCTAAPQTVREPSGNHQGGLKLESDDHDFVPTNWKNDPGFNELRGLAFERVRSLPTAWKRYRKALGDLPHGQLMEARRICITNASAPKYVRYLDYWLGDQEYLTDLQVGVTAEVVTGSAEWLRQEEERIRALG